MKSGEEVRHGFEAVADVADNDDEGLISRFPRRAQRTLIKTSIIINSKKKMQGEKSTLKKEAK